MHPPDSISRRSSGRGSGAHITSREHMVRQHLCMRRISTSDRISPTAADESQSTTPNKEVRGGKKGKKAPE